LLVEVMDGSDDMIAGGGVYGGIEGAVGETVEITGAVTEVFVVDGSATGGAELVTIGTAAPPRDRSPELSLIA